MIVIACVDEKNGMMFHGRRQSRDRILQEDVLRECKGKKLYMNSRSYALFKDDVKSDIELCVAEDFLDRAGKEDYCFTEDGNAMADYLEEIQAVLVYRWNRRYPADVYFPIDLAADGWEWKSREEFQGSSHERITKERYHRLN